MSRSRAKLHLVSDDAPEPRIFGSREFIARTRNPALPSPTRFEMTLKKEGDIVL